MQRGPGGFVIFFAMPMRQRLGRFAAAVADEGRRRRLCTEEEEEELPWQ